MPDKVVVYHNPRCSKSRGVIEILNENGVAAEVIQYLDTPPDKKELKRLMKLLGIEDPRDMMRKGEKEYMENGLDDPDLTLDALLNTIVRYPILLERPIVVKGGKAVIGRPPENVLTLL